VHISKAVSTDRGVNTFSPEGRLFQGELLEFPCNLEETHTLLVEYANEAIKVLPESTLPSCCLTYHQLGSTTVGVCTSGGVVLGVEKRVQSPLLESSSIEKVVEIDKHLGCAMSGSSSFNFPLQRTHLVSKASLLTRGLW
jgi:20S proteasome subunit alpha 5